MSLELSSAHTRYI